MRYFIITCILFVFIILIACEKTVCPGLGDKLIPVSPYEFPIWHPNGEYIGFNHIPLQQKIISYPNGKECAEYSNYLYNSDSIGFYLMTADGDNPQRILSKYLQTPEWSPNGEWIVFVENHQIFKIKFVNVAFDTSTIFQLSFDGRNHFPTWSPDGENIAYVKTICQDSVKCGIWLMSSNGDNDSLLIEYGEFPTWHPNGETILFSKTAVSKDGSVLGDSVFSYSFINNKTIFLILLSGNNHENRYFKYSPDGNKIVFASQSNIKTGIVNVWVYDLIKNNIYNLVSDGSTTPSWSPNFDEIVYLRYNYEYLDRQEGTIWEINLSNYEKKQLTYNNYQTIYAD